MREDVKQLISHLKWDVEFQTAVKCPFINCTKLFENVTTSTFKSHVSRRQQKSGGSLDNCWYINSEGVSNRSDVIV
jgi:hypothetical protein